MIVQSLIKWSETAKSSERAQAALALAQAFAEGLLGHNEEIAAEAAMAMLVEDASPKVRLALAEGLATADNAPRTIILALATDQIEVAGHIIALSPLLDDADLIDIVAGGRAALQQIVAFRRPLAAPVAAAIAEVGGAAAVADLLDNPDAHIARISLRRIAERFGDHNDIRAQLFDRPDLPCDVRQSLVEKLGAAFAGFGFVRETIGGERVRKVTEEACIAATLNLAEAVALDELPALVEHLRVSGRLTPAFLIHALCMGNVDFFAAAIVSLTGMADGRVRGILIDGREAAIRALHRAVGLSADVADVFVSATLLWRDAARGRRSADPCAVTADLIRRHAGDARDNPVISDLLRLVEVLHLNWRRRASRSYAAALAAEAA